MVGNTLGRYRLLEEIGQGGMAVVYRGMDTTLQREVAVKILHPHLSRKESNRIRFAREARVVATLHHDNIVEIYDFSGGEDTGSGAADAFIVTEYIRGRTLAEFLETHGAIPIEVGVLVVVEVCGALAHAHAEGIVHRDIKPENVMIRQDGVLKLMDFGIARVADELGGTMTGTLLGSPQFMSPEQVSYGELDARSDLFSLGVLLYRLTVGTFPFDGTNPAAILNAIVHQAPEPPDRLNPRIGRAVAAATRRALSKDRKDRQAGASELGAELQAAIADAGMGSTREELQAYFSDPEAYARALNTRLITRYTEAGHARAKARDTAGAMELWSRVLELDGDNLEVRAALERLGRGRKARRTAAVLLGIPLLGVGLVAGAVQGRQWLESAALTDPPPTPTTVAAGATATANPSPDAAGIATAGSAPPTPTPAGIPSGLPSGSPGRTVSPGSSPTGSPTQVAMVPTPRTPGPLPDGKGALVLDMIEYATITIEGNHHGNSFQTDVMQGGIILDPGTHAITLTPNEVSLEAGCRTLEARVRIVAGERTSKLEVDGFPRDDPYFLRCPMSVRVLVSPPVEAQIFLDDAVEPSGFSGAEIKTVSGPHEIRVVHPDYEEYRQRLEVRPSNRLDSVMEVQVVLIPKIP